MKKQSIFISIFLMFLILPNLTFADTYTESDMSNRETTVIDGVTYINYGEPVAGFNYQGGLYVSENYIDANGVPHKVRRGLPCSWYKF